MYPEPIQSEYEAFAKSYLPALRKKFVEKYGEFVDSHSKKKTDSLAFELGVRAGFIVDSSYYKKMKKECDKLIDQYKHSKDGHKIAFYLNRAFLDGQLQAMDIPYEVWYPKFKKSLLKKANKAADKAWNILMNDRGACRAFFGKYFNKLYQESSLYVEWFENEEVKGE